MITSLVDALGLEHELKPLPSILGSFTLDIAACHSEYIIRAKSPDRYTLMIDHREIASILLRDPRHIDVHDNHNWIFDVEDNKDEEANQLPPEGGANIDMDLIWNDPPTPPPSPHIHVSPVRIIHFFANHFVGTFFGHQSREEYDYVGIQTSLGDVLFQLCDHHNAYV